MWVTPEQIEKASQMDLLTYLQNYEPGNLKKICSGTYCTKEHDSLKISNGMWHWFSRNIGGRNALDYLIKVKGVSFVKAVEMITGYSEILPPVYARNDKKEENKVLETVPYHTDINRVRKYLNSRGIDDIVINYCHMHEMLFEDTPYHNCVFLGYDGDMPKYGAVRSTVSDFKRDLSGSDKRFSFCIHANENADTVHLFEAAIDLMSYATLEIRANRNWCRDDLLSLAGVYKTDNKQDIPLALRTYLERHNTKTIYLHLDNDDIGRTATKQIAERLSGQYEIIDRPPQFGKDYNEYLLHEIQKEKRKEYER